jgi:peptidoglycan hydrolase-like protein with peptidoglycan-binding domain
VTPPSLTIIQPMAPSPTPVEEPLYGPGSSTGNYYTDAATVTAVQKKLKALGYYPYSVDGKYGPNTDAAILNYSGQHGPPDDALLQKLGLREEIKFDDDEADSAKIQAATATTPAQVQVVAAKVENLTKNSSPEVKAQAQQAKQAAATAVTPTQVQQAKQQVQQVISNAQAEQGMPGWKIGLIAGGVAAGSALLFGVISLFRRK